MSPQAKRQFQAESAQSIEEEIKAFVATSPANRLSFINDYIMWNEPLVKFADADNPIFNEYKSIIAPTYLTPREALAVAYNKEPFCVNPATITPPSCVVVIRLRQ